jgi:crotonobetainyl-CoA:carnitine CoA-transferase CaiB-like acyl-CoA transferase
MLGIPEIATDERFATNPQRVAHRDELIALLADIFVSDDGARWLDGMSAAGIPCGPINTIDQVMTHPQIEHRGMIVDVPHPTAGSVKVVGPPVIMSDTPAQVRSHPPLLGEQTDEILRGRIGLSQDEIARLRDEGAI